jgi:hypothetical protein
VIVATPCRCGDATVVIRFDHGCMRGLGRMFVVLGALALGCAGLSVLVWTSNASHIAGLGEVVAVAEGTSPGTVIVRTVHDSHTSYWLVNDSGDLVDSAKASDATAAPRTEHCAGDECFRVAMTSLRVDSSNDRGRTFVVAWEMPADVATWLGASYPDLGDPAEHLSSRAVVVHATPRGTVVFVANGRDGLLYRSPAGDWQRLGFPSSGEGVYFEPPLRTSIDPPVLDPTRPVVAGVAVVILIGGAIALYRRRRWRGTVPVILVAGLGGYGAWLATDFPDMGMFPGVLYGAQLIGFILTGGVALAVWFGAGAPLLAELRGERSTCVPAAPATRR